jgi:hypothetical protein
LRFVGANPVQFGHWTQLSELPWVKPGLNSAIAMAFGVIANRYTYDGDGDTAVIGAPGVASAVVSTWSSSNGTAVAPWRS